VNYILKVEGNNQLPGINNVLSAKDKGSELIAKISYIEANTAYKKLEESNINEENIETKILEIIEIY